MESPGIAANEPLPTEFLAELVGELDRAEVAGIILGGSHARGNATPLSDVDIALLVRETAQVRPRDYFYREGRLVSVTTKSLAGIRADMDKPQIAVRLVPGLSEAVVLLDKDGSVDALMQDLAAFSWATLQENANRCVSEIMLHVTEPVQKLANELLKRNAPGVAYATGQLLSALNEGIIVHHGIMVESDSTYCRQAEEAVGADSEWAKYHRRAAGLTSARLQVRAKACLHLHRLTLQLVRPVMSKEHAAVAEEAARRVEFLYT